MKPGRLGNSLPTQKPTKPEITGGKEFWEVIAWLWLTGIFLLRLLYWHLFEKKGNVK